MKPSVETTAILKAAAVGGIIGTESGSAPRLLAALCDPEASAGGVTELIGQNPALSLRVLRVANSAYYGQPRSIARIDRAVGLLGLDAVRGIAAAACLDRVLPRGDHAVALDLGALVRHSRAAAVAADTLARSARPHIGSDAFIAGLLHNLGTTVQFHLSPPGMKPLLDARAAGVTGGLRQLEIHHQVIGHESCGAVIFGAWSLPDSLIAATRHHHGPMAAPEADRDLAALVHVGAHLALAAGFTFALEPAAEPLDPAVLDWLGLETAQLAEVAAGLPERVAALDQALSGA